METIGENSTNRSDSGDDFEGFDGLCDAQKTVRKFECIQEAIREWKCAFTRNDKDSCFKKDCYVENEKYTCKYCVDGSREMFREENNNYKKNASSFIFDKKPPKKKFLQKCHIESDTTNEIGNLEKENPDIESHSDN
ncbi:uncharacterized protein LOC111051821 [Nilaparvata lugens]|uniref:uncharacterized protein LOC111051821 n=1 Tax=Nilaparvata lugens TaxID=108931 RepID=UPI00193DA403|nr:uncharacterized protein LOC111051821 [Nilaparvata lugens]